MRTVIVFGVVGLALALATQLPRSPGRDPPVAATGSADQASSGNWSRYSPPASAALAPAVLDHRGADTHEPVVVEWDDDLAEGEVALEQSTVANAEEGEGVLERLSASGLSRDRAEEVLRRESQLRRAAAFAEYRATGTIGPLNAWPADVEQTRAELGDADYERYLQATGQQTRVIVGDVEPASAAANAGIIPEDQILAYAGRRVFNLRDLNALMLRTSSGETVAATVVRDGQTLQLYVTGGPLGLSQLRMR